MVLINHQLHFKPISCSFSSATARHSGCDLSISLIQHGAIKATYIQMPSTKLKCCQPIQNEKPFKSARGPKCFGFASIIRQAASSLISDWSTEQRVSSFIVLGALGGFSCASAVAPVLMGFSGPGGLASHGRNGLALFCCSRSETKCEDDDW